MNYKIISLILLLMGAPILGSPEKLSNDLRNLRNQNFDQLLQEFEVPLKFGLGSDIVGNGGGRHEGLIQFYYQNLEYYILTSLNQNDERFTKNEFAILTEIINASIENRAKKKLNFLYKHPQTLIFRAMYPDAPRLAVTGFSTNYPIYLNMPLSYQWDEVDSQTWLMLLIHELGHQIGIADHSYLDQLAAKVAFYNKAKENNIELKVKNKFVKISYYNYVDEQNSSEVIVTTKNKSINLKKISSKKLNLACDQGTNLGYTLTNLHWLKESFETYYNYFSAKAWIKVKCIDRTKTATYTNTRELNIKINFNKDSSEISNISTSISSR